MNLQQLPLISIVTFLPLVGAVILFFVKKENTELIKRFTLVWTIITFVVSLGFCDRLSHRRSGVPIL